MNAPQHIPVAQVDHERDLLEAWAVHSALIFIEALRPELRDNPRFKILRMDAYEAFHNLMARSGDGR